MSPTAGLAIVAIAIGAGWLCSWAWRQIPTAQCPRCYSYQVDVMQHPEFSCATGLCSDCGWEGLV